MHLFETMKLDIKLYGLETFNWNTRNAQTNSLQSPNVGPAKSVATAAALAAAVPGASAAVIQG